MRRRLSGESPGGSKKKKNQLGAGLCLVSRRSFLQTPPCISKTAASSSWAGVKIIKKGDIVLDIPVSCFSSGSGTGLLQDPEFQRGGKRRGCPSF